MHSSTSNSEATLPWARFARITGLTLLALAIVWEGCWRWKGFVPSHKDDVGLWSDERDRLKEAPLSPAPIAVIGTSRIYYGLDTRLVEGTTGRPLMQLAINGTSPVPVLEDLAADENFRGLVLADVALPTFFDDSLYVTKAASWVGQYRTRGISERINHRITMAMEKLFVYPEKTELFFQLVVMTQVRPPGSLGSTQLSIVDERRRSAVGPFVEKSEKMRELIIQEQLRDLGEGHPVGPERRDRILAKVARATERIMERGGQVVFLQYPATGELDRRETKAWPRAEYWDHLAKLKSNAAIHYADVPGLTGFTCIDESHLTKSDRTKFTGELLAELKRRGVL